MFHLHCLHYAEFLQKVALQWRCSPKQYCGQLHTSVHSVAKVSVVLCCLMADFMPLSIFRRPVLHAYHSALTLFSIHLLIQGQGISQASQENA